jgi:pimeloyl-ACP methyl ester carboxylesterase
MKHWCLGCMLLICLATLSMRYSLAEEYPFHSEQDIAGAQSGEMLIKTGIFQIGAEQYDADYCTMVVPENRNSSDSRLINLPVVRIRSKNNEPKEPVFLLTGGPGASNIWERPPSWLLEHHDLVMVGYRGYDGSVFLECPEVAEAVQVVVDPLSNENIKKLGIALNKAYERFRSEGVDIDGYTMVEVVDDIDNARDKLGYGKANLYSFSYGTRIAYIYGLKYPDSIHRSFMYCINPPGGSVWEPDIVDSQLRYYSELWKKSPKAVSRTPDLLATIQNVLGELPKNFGGVNIDPGKVKIMSFLQLSHVGSAAMVFDAFVAAGNGDYSGLAFLSASYDMMMPNIWNRNWGEGCSKAVSSDYDPERDYMSEMMPKGSIFGSPVSKMLWGALQYGGWPIKPIPAKYRTLQHSDVQTLMVNGNVDFSTPLENAQKLLPYLRNGKLVILKEMGHAGDVSGMQAEAFQHMAKTFYLTGEVDDSRFRYQPVNFTPAKTFGEMAAEFAGQRQK